MTVGITGHQHIPSASITYIQQGISNVLSSVEADIVGVSSLAAGSDQIFASAVIEHGGRLHAIIPCHGYKSTFSDKSDLDRFLRLRDCAFTVETLEYPEPSEDAFLIAGYRVVDNSDLLIAVWDGMPAKGKGGTAEIVQYARSSGTNVKVIWPLGVVR